MADGFDDASRDVRERLAPVVGRVLARHGRPPVALAEPRSAMAVWFALDDGAGTPLVLVCANADGVSFLLGRRGFLHHRDTASLPADGLLRWFEDVLDGALRGGLQVHDDATATLRTRSGAVALSMAQ
jgi:hypothetical protein